MDITAVNRGAIGPHAPAPTATVDKAVEQREVIQAVKAINGTEMFGPENQLNFQRDAATGRMVVKVVNRKTRKVVSQVPSEAVLRLAVGIKTGIKTDIRIDTGIQG
jgi:uncharacterized FlaG/YvyC family protein